jgi:hypothetical protein
MKRETNELIGPALDWAVAVAENKAPRYCEVLAGNVWYGNCGSGFVQYRPSDKWDHGGPIIERERLLIEPEIGKEGAGNAWCAIEVGGMLAYGATILIAAMRCYVASKLGDEIDVPEGL